MRRGTPLASRRITIWSGASRNSSGKMPTSDMKNTGPFGEHTLRLAGSVSLFDSAAPHSVKGGFAGQRVFWNGGGPAGSSNEPVGTKTPVNPRSLVLRGFAAASGVGWGEPQLASIAASESAQKTPRIRRSRGEGWGSLL